MYTVVKGAAGAAAAAAGLAEQRLGGSGSTPGAGVTDQLPLLVDLVQAESGVVEPEVAARALVQAGGDTARAVSLVRAWAACLPRAGRSRARLTDLHLERRITPAFREPPGGQYLGASLDYAQRLLDLDPLPAPAPPSATNGNGSHRDSFSADDPHEDSSNEELPVMASLDPLVLGRAAHALEAEGIVDAGSVSRPVDGVRGAPTRGHDRGALQQLLSRAETGAATAVAYTAVRGDGGGADPTLLELRIGTIPVSLAHPDTGRPVTLGTVVVSHAEVALYGMQAGDRGPDPRFTLGVGVTVGRVERRAISAAVLDARCARLAASGKAPTAPAEDAELLEILLDGQEASGFVEHLKLPHHVTFTSDLDRVRAVAAGADPLTVEEPG